MDTYTIVAWSAPGGPELLLILLVILVLFGAKRLPELARSVGRSLGEFKKGREEGAQSGMPTRTRRKARRNPAARRPSLKEE